MKILAFDPYLSEDKAKELNVIRATVDEIAEQADFVTVHTPLTIIQYRDMSYDPIYLLLKTYALVEHFWPLIKSLP